MGTTAQKLQKLADTKAAIGQVITGAGGTLPQKFADYSTALSGAITATGQAATKEVLRHVAQGFFDGDTYTAAISDTTITSVRQYAFYNCSWLTSFDAPNCTAIGSGSFQNATKLAYLNLPLLQTVPTRSLQGTVALKRLVLPSVYSFANSIFQSMTTLEEFEIGEDANGGGGISNWGTVFGTAAGNVGTFALRVLKVWANDSTVNPPAKWAGLSASQIFAPNLNDVWFMKNTMAWVKSKTYYSTWYLPTTCTIHCTDGSFTYGS